MNQTEPGEPLTTEVFQMWSEKAETSKTFADAWRDYAMMMTAFQTALERAPHTAEACDHVDIESLLISEIEHVADMVHAIFPCGGILEFASYLTCAKKRAWQRSSFDLEER